MLKDKQKTLGILKHLSDSLSVPLSLKTRLGLNRDDIPGQYDFLVEAAQYVWMIGIHGRLYNQ
jgi:tRNA-dihydrouridine synthase